MCWQRFFKCSLQRLLHFLGVQQAPVTYDAFVVMSDQHAEMDSLDVVSPADVCRNLTKQGFTTCQADLQHYNASIFMNATKHLGWQNKEHHYPFRIASYLSTHSRCLRNIAEQNGKTLSRQYDAIIFARMDMMNFKALRYWDTVPRWYNWIQQGNGSRATDIIGMRGRGRLEDKLIICRHHCHAFA